VSAPRAAIYAAASRFITAGTLVLQALRLTLAPEVSAALARHDTGRVSEMYRVATQWVVLSSWPLYLIMAVFPATVLQLFGPSYSDGATALTILCLAMLVSLAAGNVQTVLLMGGKSAWVLANKAACLALNIALNLVLIPRLGINGAALAWAATIVLDSSLSFGQVRWGMRIAGSLRGIAIAAAVSVASFTLVPLVVKAAAGPSFVSLVVAFAAAATVFALPVWRFRDVLGVSALLSSLRHQSAS
jgi:O-antigen/teichoic acid export membrane protein